MYKKFAILIFYCYTHIIATKNNQIKMHACKISGLSKNVQKMPLKSYTHCCLCILMKCDSLLTNMVVDGI